MTKFFRNLLGTPVALLYFIIFSVQGASSDIIFPMGGGGGGENAGPSPCAQKFMGCWGTAFQQFLQANIMGMPETTKEIQVLCMVIPKAFQCLDSFANDCFTQAQLKMYSKYPSGVRNVTNRLCNDKNFQTEYLKHGKCYQKLENEVEPCFKPLASVMPADPQNMQTAVESQLENVCSIKENVVNCVTEVATRRCDASAAAFFSQMVGMLTEGLSDKCNQPIPTSTMKHQLQKDGPSHANGLFSCQLIVYLSAIFIIFFSS